MPTVRGQQNGHNYNIFWTCTEYGQKTGPLCFTGYNFRNIEQSLYQIWQKSRSLHSEHHAI